MFKIKDIKDTSKAKEYEKSITNAHYAWLFSKKKTLFRKRKYGHMEGIRVFAMAEDYRYIRKIGKNHEPSLYTIRLTGDGFYFTSIFRLIEALAKSVVSIGNLLAVALSAIAIYISLKK